MTDAGGLGEDFTDTVQWTGTCADSADYKYALDVQAYDDEILNQSYNEVRENKTNRWYVHGWFPNKPESPVDPSEPLYSNAFAEGVEFFVEQACGTDGSSRVQFSDPYPNTTDTNDNPNGSFAIQAGVGIFGVSIGGSVGFGFDTGPSITYDDANGAAHESYWDISTSTLPGNPKNGNSTAVGIDVECYTPYDSSQAQYEYVKAKSQFTFQYYDYTFCGAFNFVDYYATTNSVSDTIGFEVGPP